MTYDTPARFAVQGYGTTLQHALVAEKERLIHETCLSINRRMLQTSLETEVAEALGAPYAARSASQTSWTCRKCQAHNTQLFHRNGHYRRSVTMREGTVEIKMPLIQCACQGYVEVPWQTIDKRARYWLDVELDGVRHYLAGMSYRLVGDALSGEAQTNISHVQAWRTMQAVGAQARTTSEEGGPSPRSVILDEAYLSVEGEKQVFLLAVADDGRDLAVWGPARRTVDDWQALLEHLTEQGISPMQGLVGVTYDGDSAIREAVRLVWPTVVLQQCVWHILERVADDVAAVYGVRSADVERIVGQAAGVFLYDPDGREGDARAHQCWTAFAREHPGTPWAATVGRAFAEGTEYLRTPGLPRTNGAAERMIKELRRRTGSMDGFKSADGATHFVLVWRVWKNRRLAMNKARARQARPRRPHLKIRAPHPKPA